ncbi:SAM-dependent methyltransferase [Streptomyces sodiiphilus]|uniref:SAM-dependent methyltransferase n=1 Tax=Streptomyces sodiiphilus TaxID=226217 RepID=A0ABP5ABC5_9ACTN
MSDGTYPGIDLTQPSIARAYDYMLGGKNNYAVDRAVVDHILANLPGSQSLAVENRKALVRAVREMTVGRGMRQFLDIGSGLPTADNVHQVAQSHVPGTRVAYVDNDPVVLAHGRALLEENDRTAVIRADLRNPQEIREHPQVTDLIDFQQPVGIVLCAILHHLNDEEDPAAVVRYWIDAVPSGSCFFLTHFRTRHTPETEEIERIAQENFGRGRWRDDDEIRALFDGLEILEPGILPAAEWRSGPRASDELTVWEQMIVAGLAVKP